MLSAHKSQNSVSKAFETDLTIVVVIPCFNVEKTIADVVAGILRYVGQVVLVNDASRDRTFEIVESLKSDHVRVVHLPQNCGVGAATVRGYKEALALGAEVIVKVDGDGQMDPNYLTPLLAPILAREADYTKGNRFLHERELESMPFARRVGNFGLSFLTKLASGYWNVFDPTNGYTAIHAALIPLLNQASIDRRYFFETSMLMELGLLRAVVRDVYVPARYSNETSNLSELKALFEFPPRLFRGGLRRLWIQYFLRDFGLFSVFFTGGLVLFSFGVIFGAYNWWLYAQLREATPTGTIMLAVLPIILGVQFLLQAVVLDVQNLPSNSLSKSYKKHVAKSLIK